MKPIRLVFCPGSYGSYFGWCVYSYSNLNNGPIDLPFTDNGSAHKFREKDIPEIEFSHKIHLPATILIRPTDFFNYSLNQNAKLDGTHIPIKSDIKWVNRELISIFIEDFARNQALRYSHVKYEVCVTTNDILFNIISTLDFVLTTLSLIKTVDDSTILKNHELYMSLQRFATKSQELDVIVNAILTASTDKVLENLTVYDEAYIQYKLRVSGYELLCDGLNEFPRNTIEFKKLIYKKE